MYIKQVEGLRRVEATNRPRQAPAQHAGSVELLVHNDRNVAGFQVHYTRRQYLRPPRLIDEDLDAVNLSTDGCGELLVDNSRS